MQDLAARVVAVGKMLDGAGFLEIFESLRAEHQIPARTAWSIAIRVVVGGGSVKDAIYLRESRPNNLLRWDVEVPANCNGEKAFAINYEFRMELDRQLAITGFQSK